MSKSIVANRYALALFTAAEEKGKSDDIQQELVEIQKVFKNNAALEELLHSPKLSNAKKKDLLSELFNGANPLILNALFVLLDKKRMDEVIHFIDEYTMIANDKAGVADAVVYSVQALTEAQTNSISAAFAVKIGKRSLRIENIIDSSLIGGIRVQIGNQIFDSSLSGKLSRLQKDLIKS